MGQTTGSRQPPLTSSYCVFSGHCPTAIPGLSEERVSVPFKVKRITAIRHCIDTFQSLVSGYFWTTLGKLSWKMSSQVGKCQAKSVS